jgi:hypothetical protein
MRDRWSGIAFGDVEALQFDQISDLRTEIHTKFERCEEEFGYCREPERNAFYGSTDALQDTDEAIRALTAGFSAGREKLEAYGLLQSLFVQQDAALMIEAVIALGSVNLVRKKPHEDTEFGDIRIFRNRVAGHPAYAVNSGRTAAIPLVHPPYRLGAAIYGIPDRPVAERNPEFHIGDLVRLNAAGIVPILTSASELLDQPKVVFERLARNS